MAKTAPQIATYAHVRATLLREGATKAELRSTLEEVAVQLRVLVPRGVPKAQAAKLLGVSRPTLDRWIGLGKIHMVTDGQRKLVDSEGLAALLVEVEQLREMGQDRHVLSMGLHRLAQQDVDGQARLAEMLRPGLEAMERGDLVPLVIPDNFGPDD